MSADNEQLALAVTPAGASGADGASPAPPPLTDARLAAIAARAAELEAACAAWDADHWGGSAGARYWSAMFESGRDVRALLPEVDRLRADAARARAMLDRYCAELPQPVHLPDAAGWPSKLAALIDEWNRLRAERDDARCERDANTALRQEVATLRAGPDAALALLAELVRANRDGDSPERFIVLAEGVALRAAALLTPDSSPEVPR